MEGCLGASTGDPFRLKCPGSAVVAGTSSMNPDAEYIRMKTSPAKRNLRWFCYGNSACAWKYMISISAARGCFLKMKPRNDHFTGV